MTNTPSLKVLDFPDRDIRDVPERLRTLAKRIEDGDYGDAHNLVWVLDCGNGRVETGLLGPAPEPGLTAHLLLCIAARKIEAL